MRKKTVSRDPVFGYFLVNDLQTPPQKDPFGKTFQTILRRKKILRFFFLNMFLTVYRIFFFDIVFTIFFLNHPTIPTTGAEPLDLARFWIEDPGRNRSTEYLAINPTRFFEKKISTFKK